MDVTKGTLLNGKLAYTQPLEGYRTGIEPVFLAACVPAKPGERVLEAGCGAGAGLLCLAARVPGISGVGVEIDAGMAELARENFAGNFAGLQALQGDILAPPAGLGEFDHGFANPPWHSPRGTASPVAAKRLAKSAGDGLIAAWIAALVQAVRARGSVSVILPACWYGDGVAAMRAEGCGEVTLVPLWQRAGRPAKIVIVQGKKASRGAARIHPGLVLHDGTGFSAAAEAILRGGGKMLEHDPPTCDPLADKHAR